MQQSREVQLIVSGGSFGFGLDLFIDPLPEIFRDDRLEDRLLGHQPFGTISPGAFHRPPAFDPCKHSTLNLEEARLTALVESWLSHVHRVLDEVTNLGVGPEVTGRALDALFIEQGGHSGRVGRFNIEEKENPTHDLDSFSQDCGSQGEDVVPVVCGHARTGLTLGIGRGNFSALDRRAILDLPVRLASANSTGSLDEDIAELLPTVGTTTDDVHGVGRKAALVFASLGLLQAFGLDTVRLLDLLTGARQPGHHVVEDTGVVGVGDADAVDGTPELNVVRPELIDEGEELVGVLKAEAVDGLDDDPIDGSGPDGPQHPLEIIAFFSLVP